MLTVRAGSTLFLSGTCDFETQLLCGWAQSKADQDDWVRNSLGTGSWGTGPLSDHTSVADIISE